MSIHKSTGHNEPWNDSDILTTLYVDYGVSSEKMGRYWGCDPKTVRNNLEVYGIDRREPGHYQKKDHAVYRVEENGYCTWRDYSSTETTGLNVPVHRVLAVAKYGFGELDGFHVHHKDGVKWHNTMENIELKTPSEHAKDHYENGDLELDPHNRKEIMSELQ